MKTKITTERTWADRLRLLSRSLRLTMRELSARFGFSTPAPIRRLLSGGRPTVQIVLQLKALENLYADEIAAYLGGNHTKRRRGTHGSSPRRRPEDLAQMGASGSIAQSISAGGNGYGGVEAAPLKVVRFTAQMRAYARTHYHLKRGRPKVVKWRPPAISEGIIE